VEFGHILFGTAIGVICLTLLPALSAGLIVALFRWGKRRLASTVLGIGVLAGLSAAGIFMYRTLYDPPFWAVLLAFIWGFGIASFVASVFLVLLSDLRDFIRAQIAGRH